jgi:hypothetical protein
MLAQKKRQIGPQVLLYRDRLMRSPILFRPQPADALLGMFDRLGPLNVQGRWPAVSFVVEGRES